MANTTVPLREKVDNLGRRGGKLVKEFKQLPAIILLDKRHRGSDRTKKCLLESRFRTWEAANIFDALEGISDFTLHNRPDIVLLEVDSLTADFQLVIELLHVGELGFPVFALSDSDDSVDSSDLFEGDFTQIAALLEEIVPKRSTVKNPAFQAGLLERGAEKSGAFQTCLKEIADIQKHLKAAHDEIELLKRKTRAILTNI